MITKKITRISQSLLAHSITRNVSSSKFHQLAKNIDKNDIIHPLYQNNLITKYLTTQNHLNSNTINNNKNINSNHNLSHSISSKNIKSINYNQILNNSPRGSIIQQKYKNSHLCLMGMNYSNTSYQNIYKTIIKFQPDCILVQNRPQLFNQHFQEIKKYSKTNVFSDKLYIEQLNALKCSKLIKDKFATQEGKKILEQKIFPRKSHKSPNSNKPVFPFLQTDIVQQKPLLTSIYHSLYESAGTPIYLSQLPQKISRQWLCNTNTLMQLQQIFKQTCKALPLYPATNITPYQLASYMFAQQFFSINDKYMAAIIEIMLVLGHKRVLMFSGVGENEAVWEILEKELHCDEVGNILPMIQSLIPPQVKGSLVRDYDPLQLIEKHILVDALYYGFNLKHIAVNKFSTTNAIIKHYGKQQSDQMLFKFRYEMCMKYSELLDQCVRQGQERKRKEFMRTVIRQQ